MLAMLERDLDLQLEQELMRSNNRHRNNNSMVNASEAVVV